jgi:16S rRNA (cytosine967-C5)-methyltransferase
MPRVVAWKVLRSGSPTPLRDVDSAAAAAGLNPLDRGLARALVGTEVRRRGTLRALVNKFAHRHSSPNFTAHLHLGLVQLCFMDRVPPHAAVGETVGAVRDTLGSSKVKAANGILRAAQRALKEGTSGDPTRDIVGRDLHLAEAVFHDPAEHPFLWAEDALSMPAPLMKKWTKRFGEEQARAMALQALTEPPISVRVVDGDRDRAMAELVAVDLNPRPGVHPHILLLSAASTEALLASAPFQEGRLTVQGEAALRAAEALEAKEGESLLDLCSAPGGKTAVLAASGAKVLASDIGWKKLALVESTLERLKLKNVRRVANETGVLGTELFDGVLIDAPCTNTAVLAARPEARWRLGPTAKKSLLETQAALLAQGAKHVRTGGRVVWSTCALDPDENRRLIDQFLEARPEFTLEAEAETLPDLATTQDEGSGPVDGGYFARLRRGG